MLADVPKLLGAKRQGGLRRQPKKLSIIIWQISTIKKYGSIHLTSVNTVIAAEMVAMGTLTESSVDCKRILRAALLQNAASIVLTHNHSSGNPEPSVSDIRFTAQLNNACKLMDINLLDHVILASNSCYSFEQCKSYNY